MPTRQILTAEDGTELFMPLPDDGHWRMRERAAEEPLIWYETDCRIGNREYRDHSDIFIEDELWQALDTRFPDQLGEYLVGNES